jgi:hypothetical protein
MKPNYSQKKNQTILVAICTHRNEEQINRTALSQNWNTNKHIKQQKVVRLQASERDDATKLS